MISNEVFDAKDFQKMDMSSGIDPKILMENAAKRLYERMISLKLDGKKIVIVCSKGNNGGDGYTLACLMKDKCDVTVLKLDEPKSELTRFFHDRFIEMGGHVVESLDVIDKAEVIVDAIFGFSFHGQIREDYYEVVDRINSSAAIVLSVDVPSGIDCDSLDFGKHVKSDIICTFTALKRALTSDELKDETDKIYIEDIGIPKDVIVKSE